MKVSYSKTNIGNLFFFAVSIPHFLRTFLYSLNNDNSTSVYTRNSTSSEYAQSIHAIYLIKSSLTTTRSDPGLHAQITSTYAQIQSSIPRAAPYLWQTALVLPLLSFLLSCPPLALLHHLRSDSATVLVGIRPRARSPVR
jgi:hypothetical protein